MFIFQKYNLYVVLMQKNSNPIKINQQNQSELQKIDQLGKNVEAMHYQYIRDQIWARPGQLLKLGQLLKPGQKFVWGQLWGQNWGQAKPGQLWGQANGARPGQVL